jgi:uncharacterized membrane protein YphA (DoxX/SURF4 family)
MSREAASAPPGLPAHPRTEGRCSRWLASGAAQLLCRLAVAAIFLYAAFPKIADPVELARAIANYRLLPDALVVPVAVTLPYIELLVAVMLVLGFVTRAAALVAVVLLAGFTGATAAAVVRGLDIECGCFGKSDGAVVSWLTVARDVAFLVPAAIVLAFDRGRYGIAALWRHPST